MSETPVKFEREGAVAIVTLNRPTAGNSINSALSKALMEAAITCDEDDSIRCVLLTGEGRMFCAGGDVASFSEAGDQVPALLKELTAYLHMAIARFARMGKPLVVAVNGAAAGAGFSLAMLGDLVLASPSAKFTLAYGQIGLSPDGGASWLLPRLVGLRKAQEFALTPKVAGAQEAADIGLVTRVVEGELMEEAKALAAQLSSSAIRAAGRTRNLFLASTSDTLETHLELEARTISASARDAEAREGIAAFLEKRKPDFSR